ncbi:MAG TPA: response regulator transcription factor [Nocardioides sp.]|nr:response regulator transcription factor [Nocardioides sp.]
MARHASLTRVTIVEDHELFAEALEMALSLQGYVVSRVQVREHAAPASRVLEAVLRQRPQVVVLDLDLGPVTDGAQLVRPLREAGVGVMVVSATTDRARLGQCLQLGAQAVVPKAESLNTVLGQLRAVVNGQPAMPREQREELLATFEKERHQLRDIRTRLDSLSPREAEVLAELTSGHTVSEIAHRWFVSEATVRSQVKAIRTKLGVHSQVAAVSLALRVRWQPPRRAHPV